MKTGPNWIGFRCCFIPFYVVLFHRQVKGGISSKPTGGQPILDDSPEERRARSARRTHMQEIAEGRPVVSLSGSSRSSSVRWGRLRSTRLSSWARSSRGIGGDSEGGDNGNGSGDGVGQRGRGGAIFGMLRRRPARDETDRRSVEEHSAPVRSAATTWLAQRESSQVGARVGFSSAPASGNGNVTADNPDTARTDRMTGDDHIGEERHASGDSAALIDMGRSLASASKTSAVAGVPEDPVMDENQQSGDLSPGVLSPTAMDRL